MSAASRKNDPFNFDEIYKQAGVEDLFVKKTLGELKQKQATHGPVPDSSPARPAPQAPAPKPAPNPSTFDLDFLSNIAKPGAITPIASKHKSASTLPSSGGVQQTQKPQQPTAASSRQVSDDPFALFHGVPGAAPAQRHTPPPAPVPQPVGGTGNLLDFDDGHAFPAGTAQPAAPAPAPAPAAAPPSASGPPPAAAASLLLGPEHLAPQPARREPQVVAPSPAPPPQPEASPAAAAASEPSPPPPPPDYAFHAEHHPAPPPPPYTSPDPGTGSFGAGPWARDPSRDFGSGTSYAAAPDTHPELGYIPAASEPSNSSSSSFSWSHAPSGSGISGMLKAFGKKAVRAAKAGLAQLEHALEGLDQHAGQQQGAGVIAGGPHQRQPYQPPHQPTGSTGGRGQEEDADINHDHALAWAVRLAELPPHAQQQELSQMPLPLRRKVVEVLREQIRVEHEASSQTLGHGHAPGATPGLGPGPGPASLSYSLGHGAPVPSERVAGHPPNVGPEHEREQTSPGASGAPGAWEVAPAAGGGGVTVLGAAQGHPQAQPERPPPPQQQQDVHAAHDLLGIGSGRVPPAPAVPAPAMDDLLGIGDEGPSRTELAPQPPQQQQAFAAAKPAAPSANPPPPPAAAPTVAPPAAAVHVDDMDDFFSGGRPSGQSAAAPPGPAAAAAAMHGSSSAPNLGGGRSAVSGSSSAAALADMLLHDDDLVAGSGGGDVNVDVSGYEDLYRGERGAADEPELRKRLRAQREASKHAKMKAALAEKKAMEAEEAARREAQVVLKDQYKADIEAWKNKHKGNIRGLLVTLQTVLWQDSGWVPVGVGDLLEPAQIKKVYMRANLLVHPDKVRQRNGTPEQVAIADMVFDVLKDAWNVFR